MSLLQQNSQEEDDAARGEELTKGSSNVLLASGIAALLVILAIFLYFRLGEKPPVATGEVTSVQAHPMHRETSAFDAAGAAMSQDKFEQVLVFAHVKLHNQSKLPLFLHQAMMNVTLDDGIHTSYVATPTDYERAFKAYAELAPFHGTPLPSEPTIEPGKDLEGDLLAAFRMTQQEWDARKGLDFAFGFRYQPLLKVTPTGPAVDK
jgi:hypothetical protein